MNVIPLSRGSWGGRTANLVVVAVLAVLACIAMYALIVQNLFLCYEVIFLAFIPYVLWSAYRRVGTLDLFAPDVGFPVAYVLYLFLGSVELPFKTQFGLTLPSIIWLYYILGLVAYLAGVRLLRPPPPDVAAHGKPKIFWPDGRFLAVTFILLAIGMLARLVDIARFGIAIFHSENEAARTLGVGGGLGVLALCMEVAFECLVLYLLVRKPGKALRVLIFVLVTLVVLNAVGTTNRTGLLRIFLAAIVTVHYTRRRIKFFGALLIVLLAVSFASALGTFREVSEWGDARIQSLEDQGFNNQTYWLFNGYDAVRLPTETFYMTLQEVPEISPHTYGTTSLASLAEILPGHRPGPSEIVKNTLHLQFVGFGAAATILAPMWIDGGVLGILIGMFLVGLISREIHRRVLTSSSYLWILVYGWFFQNALKAIKDDILPELGVTFVITLFFVVNILAGYRGDRKENG